MLLSVLEAAEIDMIKPKVRMSERGPVGEWKKDSNSSLVRTRRADWKSLIAKSITQSQEPRILRISYVYPLLNYNNLIDSQSGKVE